MIRSITAMLLILILTGCSELRVIGKAAVKELQAEAINVEWVAYQQRDEIADIKAGKRTIVAKEKTLLAKTEQRHFTGRGQVKHAEYRKGLWEGR